jgi:hypothetical protein
MFADTDAVRALGAAHRVNAADLSAIAATLSSLPTAAIAAVMGPVGARFVTALAEAAARESHAVAALSDTVLAAGGTARSSAAAYDAVDHRVGESLPRV